MAFFCLSSSFSSFLSFFLSLSPEGVAVKALNRVVQTNPKQNNKASLLVWTEPLSQNKITTEWARDETEMEQEESV